MELKKIYDAPVKWDAFTISNQGKMVCLPRPKPMMMPDGESVDLWSLCGVHFHNDDLSDESKERFIDAWAYVQYKCNRAICERYNGEEFNDDQKAALKKLTRQRIDETIAAQRREWIAQQINTAQDDEELELIIEKYKIDVTFETDKDGDYTDSLDQRKAKAAQAI